MPAYQVTEPHPTVSGWARSGRGGMGNTFKAPATSNGATAKGPASLYENGLPASSSYKFTSGRGGAGNIHHPTERAIFSFDEELERQSSRDQRVKQGAAWHVGRGGAGNFAKERPLSGRKDSTSSGDSDGSSRK